MSSHIRFDPQQIGGLVAAGTTVVAAAERLGIDVELACGGRGECTSCAVRVLENPFSLSEVTDAERRQLTAEQLFESIRLGCQARVSDGECVVQVLEPAAPKTEPEPAAEPAAAGTREQIFEAFSSLPAGEQLSTALELQLKVAGDLLGTIVETPLKVGEQLIDSIFGERKKNDTEGKND